MRIPKSSFAFKIAFVFVFFLLAKCLGDTISISEPPGPQPPDYFVDVIIEDDTFQAWGDTTTTLDTVNATFYRNVGGSFQTQFYSEGTAYPMSQSWYGSWNYMEDNTKTWPIAHWKFKVESQSDYATVLFDVQARP